MTIADMTKLFETLEETTPLDGLTLGDLALALKAFGDPEGDNADDGHWEFAKCLYTQLIAMKNGVVAPGSEATN